MDTDLEGVILIYIYAMDHQRLIISKEWGVGMSLPVPN